MTDNILRTLREIPSLEYFWELLGLLVVLITALVLWRALLHRMRAVRVFDNASGQVSVSRSALTELVQSSCRSIGALNQPKVKLYTKRGKLNVSVKLKLEAGQRLTDISTRIQEHLTQTLQDTLGVERIGNINVCVTAFKPSNASGDPTNYSPLKPFAKDTSIREVENTGDIGNTQPWFSPKDKDISGKSDKDKAADTAKTKSDVPQDDKTPKK